MKISMETSLNSRISFNWTGYWYESSYMMEAALIQFLVFQSCGLGRMDVFLWDGCEIVFIVCKQVSR